MGLLRETFFAKEKQSQKSRSKEKRENAFHREGWPMTPPVHRENSDQFVPNWNSIGIPVTTPRRKLSAKMRPQKRTATL